jgi:hypothetical protein
MPPSLDERLRELAEATHAQLDPSPDLLARIRASSTRRRVQPPARSLVLLGAAAAIAAVAAVAGALLLRASGHHAADTSGGARPAIARTDFISQLNAGCRRAADQYGNVQVVFPTAQAYGSAASALLPAAEGGLTGPVPPDAATTVASVNADLRDAVVQFQAAQADGLAGDTNGAKTSFEAGTTDLDKASAALAAYGATACAPHP